MAQDPDAPRITQQYRDRDHRMVYELKSGTSKLVVVAAQNPAASAGADTWRFEAHPAETPQLLVTGEWGATRGDAFRTMRDSWVERGDALGLAHFDWEKVAAALTAVRAI